MRHTPASSGLLFMIAMTDYFAERCFRFHCCFVFDSGNCSDGSPFVWAEHWGQRRPVVKELIRFTADQSPRRTKSTRSAWLLQYWTSQHPCRREQRQQSTSLLQRRRQQSAWWTSHHCWQHFSQWMCPEFNSFNADGCVVLTLSTYVQRSLSPVKPEMVNIIAYWYLRYSVDSNTGLC